MKPNPLKALQQLGQSVWLDDIRRDLIRSGALKRLIEEDGLSGMTSNPSIFEKAILESRDYDADIRELAHEGKGAEAIFESISLQDVREAADEFRPQYDQSGGRQGYVSVEVNPHFAHDTSATIRQAHKFWAALNRPNVFIKVPATTEGLPAIRYLLSEGINVNVTLLFGLPRYRQVIEAYLAGIEDRVAVGKPVSHIASVASFFVSRMDTLVDPLLDQFIALGGEDGALAQRLRGQVAVANSKAAYRIYREAFAGARFGKLARHGARLQWLLWASTSTKNPQYSDVKYVDELAGPDTINTMPRATLDAYRKHGDPKVRIDLDAAAAQWVPEQLPQLGIEMERVARELEEQGERKFCEPYDKLLATLARTAEQLAPERHLLAA